MASPTVFSFSMQDDDSVFGTSHFYFSQYNGAVLTVNGLISAANALGALLDAVTGAAIRRNKIIIPLTPDPAWKTIPLAGHSVSDTLNLRFLNAVTYYKDTFAVPALRDTLVDDAGPILTPAGAIDNLVQALRVDQANGKYTNESDQDLVTFDAAFQGVRKHRKQLTARSLRHP